MRALPEPPGLTFPQVWFAPQVPFANALSSRGRVMLNVVFPFGFDIRCSTRCFMLGEYKVGRCTRQCHQQKRPLREGEWYYSVVLEGDEEYERRDYSAEAWEGPPEGALGYWKNRMPTSDERKLVLAPSEVLIDLLRQMENFPEKAKTRYLLGLMLLRRKVVQLAAAETATADNSDLLRVTVPVDGSVIEVPTCEISRSESDQLLEELNELLYCEASDIEDDETETQSEE